MSTPIKENIAVDILAAINAITTGNGFNQTLIARRTTRIDWWNESAGDLEVLIVQEDEEETDDQPTMAKQWNIPFVIVAHVINSDDSSAAIDTRLNQVEADIKKKLMADNTRGGYAIDTTIRPAVSFANEGYTDSGIMVNIEVLMRHKINDPYTAI